MMKKRRDTETQGGGLPLFHRPSSLRPCVSAFFLLFLLSAHGAPTADRLFKQKKWREAETAYVTIATKSPLSKEGVKARYRIGVCRLKRKDQAGALRAFLRLAEDRDAARAAPETVLFAYREVWALLAIPSEDNRRMQLVRRCAAAFPSNEVSAAICAEEGLLQARRARFSDADAFFRLGGTRLSVPTPGGAESPPPISVGAAVHRVIRKGILSRSNEPFTSFLPGVEAVEKSGDWMCAAALCRGLRATRKDSPEIWRKEMDVYLAAGRFEEALACCKRIAKESPADAPECELLTAGILAERMHAPREAETAYRRWFRKHGASPLANRAILRHARFLAGSGRHVEAGTEMARLNRAELSRTETAEAEALLAELAREKKYREQAEAAKGAASPKTENPIAAARKLYAKEHYGSALKKLAAYKTRLADPAWGEAMLLYGKCLRETGNPRKAVESWDAVAARNVAAANAPLAEKCRLAKAETLLEDLDDAKGAAALYEKVTVTRENAATVIPGLVLARLAAGNTKGAETLLADAGKASLLTEPLHSRLRDALAGTFGDSRFNGSLASETPQAKAAFRTAEVLAKGGRHLRAANAYGRLEHSVKNTELAAYANLLRAECLANAGRAGKALPLLDTFKTRYRKTKRAGEGLLLAGCLSAGALRNTRQAGRYFRLSADIRTDKESAQRVLFYLATLSQWGKRRREALGLYAELLKKYPDTPFKDEIQKHRIPALRKENGDKGNEILHIKLKANKSVRQTIEVDPYVVYDVRLDAPDGYWVEKSDLTLNPYALWRKDGEPFYYLSSAFSSTQYATIAGSLNKASEEELKRPTLFTVDVPSVDIDWAGVESEPDEHIEDTNYVFCEIPSTPLQGRPFRISVRNEKGRLAKGPVKLIWNDPSLKVYRDDASQVANGAEFELPNGTMTLHAVPSSETGPFTITALGPDGESGRTSDLILGWTNPGIGTQTIAQQPVDRTRKTIGIGEEVRLTVMGNTTPILWDKTNGTLSGASGNVVLLTAPEVPCVLVVTAKFNGAIYEVTFNVIQPDTISFQYRSTLSLTLPPSCYGLKISSDIYIKPDTVNFYNLLLYESESDVFDVKGGYQCEPLQKHEANGPHPMMRVIVPGLGTRCEHWDEITGRSPSVPFESGSWYWLITWGYRVGKRNGAYHALDCVKQNYDFEAFDADSGRFTISKKNLSAWIEGQSRDLHHN